MAISLVLKDVFLQNYTRGAVLGDVAVFRYDILGEEVDKAAIEIVVPWTGDLGAAQKEAEQRIQTFALELAKATGAIP